MRNAIPGIAQQLQEKLTELCDGFLREQITFMALEAEIYED
jgi:hypothetical protein